MLEFFLTTVKYLLVCLNGKCKRLTTKLPENGCECSAEKGSIFRTSSAEERVAEVFHLMSLSLGDKESSQESERSYVPSERGLTETLVQQMYGI